MIGSLLCRKIDKKIIKLPITEVEAYDGLEDLASHAHRGKTLRNAPMFESGGRWYVYLVYGRYWMLNITTGPKDYPAAILIRSAGKIVGPGKLTQFLKINKSFIIFVKQLSIDSIPEHITDIFSQKYGEVLSCKIIYYNNKDNNKDNYKLASAIIEFKNKGSYEQALLDKVILDGNIELSINPYTPKKKQNQYRYNQQPYQNQNQNQNQHQHQQHYQNQQNQNQNQNQNQQQPSNFNKKNSVYMAGFNAGMSAGMSVGMNEGLKMSK